MVKPHAKGSEAVSAPASDLTHKLTISEAEGALILTIRVTPRAHRDTLSIDDGQLRVRLRAAPVEGAANAALIALLADRLGLPRRAISIVHGETSRIKRLAITGVTAEVLHKKLAAATVVDEPG